MPTDEKPPDVCRLGYCRGSLSGRSRSLYCCPEHSDAARLQRSLDADARRVAETRLTAVANGGAPPAPSYGWLATTDGVTLSGEVVAELHALLQAYRSEGETFARLVTQNPGIDKETKPRLLQFIARRDRKLLGAFNRVLPRPRLNDSDDS